MQPQLPDASGTHNTVQWFPLYNASHGGPRRVLPWYLIRTWVKDGTLEDNRPPLPPQCNPARQTKNGGMARARFWK